jgi:hypothetical protein
MIGFQLQDWLRRALYVKTANRAVFFSDLLAYGGQLAVLAWLGYVGDLTPVTALLALAFSFSCSALATAVIHGIRPDYVAAVSVIRQYWGVSRDFLATWQLQWLGSQGVVLLGAGMIGQQAAGAIRAALNLLGPINVAFQWMDNVVPVRAALHLRDTGRHALVAYLGRIGLVGGVVLGLFALLLLPVDEWLMVFLYGEEYRPFAILVVFQALYYLFSHGYRMAAYYYRAMGETRILAHSSFWWAVVSVGLALLAVREFGERGIMMALIAGEVAGLLYLTRWWRARPASADSNDNARTHRYVVLRRRDGSVHLVLPFTNTRVLRSALLMYYPSRWTGRLYRLTLARTLMGRAWLGWAETVDSLAGLCPDLARVLKAVPAANPAYVGLLKGAPGPRAKLTLKIMDARGKGLAYARIADSPAAVEALRREAQVLAAAGRLESSLPKVIAEGEYSGPGDYFIVESAGPECPAEAALVERHFAFLARLLAAGTVPWHAVVDQLEEDVEHLMCEPDRPGVLSDAMRFLRKVPGPAIRACIEHGDFVPWNIRSGKDGALFVLDWEHARRDGWAWLDALHFCYQTEALVRRRGPAQVLDALRAVFFQPAAREYARLYPVTEEHARALIAVYLLRMLAVGASEGYEATAHQQTMRCRMLEHLLQEQ